MIGIILEAYLGMTVEEKRAQYHGSHVRYDQLTFKCAKERKLGELLQNPTVMLPLLLSESQTGSALHRSNGILKPQCSEDPSRGPWSKNEKSVWPVNAGPQKFFLFYLAR